jgi:phosphotransferase system HPr (HPr) family protein
MAEELTRTVTVRNKFGLHNRPSMIILRTADKFESDITIISGKKRADAKSIMQIVMLAATCGTSLEVRTSGPDAQQALDEICRLLESDFEEAYQ